MVETRKQALRIIDDLWDSWRKGQIKTQIKYSLSRMKKDAQNNWKESTDIWFNEFKSFKNVIFEKTEHEQIRLDIVAGYSAFIDKLLMSQDCEIEKAKVLLGFYQKNLVLILPEGIEMASNAIGDAIACRVSFNKKLSRLLAESISYSLPAHKQIFQLHSLRTFDRSK